MGHRGLAASALCMVRVQDPMGIRTCFYGCWLAGVDVMSEFQGMLS